MLRRGPGIVWLQGTSITSMVSEIARHIPSCGGIGLGIPIIMMVVVVKIMLVVMMKAVWQKVTQ